MAKVMDLKSTLNLPRTEFPMKAKLPEREPEQLAEWERTGIYRRILDARAGAPLFVLHDGPPYPTGDIHVGTGLNKVLKDMVVKSKSMAGFRAPYVPGWDCHGLPIETKVEKELGGKKHSVTPAEFRRKCREFAAHYVDENRRDFKRLGIFGQWESPYLTMNPEYEACIADAFLTFLEKGYVYRGLKPVYWCIVDHTALAEAEVEYEDHTSPSIWVKFPVVDGGIAARLGSGVSALIWTTTPWTLPANRALAFHPDYEYVVAETSAGPLLLAASRVGVLSDELKLKVERVRGSWKGRELEGVQFQHPFLDLRVPAVLADYVALDQGSGIVHTAPGHGADDFYTGQKYGLETYAPLDDAGRFTEGLPEYEGKTVFEANPEILKVLRARGALVGEGKLTHSYPHCWRCHNPVIFRATEQWFINLEHDGLRRRALEEIGKVRWSPAWGEERLRDMIATRPDWCISRQRFWGVPLIVFTCEKCNEHLQDFGALRSVVRWFEREGADAWYSRSAEELLPPGMRCKCGGSRWRKESDILDVWFESGSSHLAVLSPAEGTWPADVYLEGPDQYRGWFHSSLLVALGVRDRGPYKQVVTHAWTLDAEGRPMSKSLGNIVTPGEVCEKWGADLLRVWVSSQDYYTDARWSDATMTQLSEAYSKIRNTFRFALGNLAGFDPARDSVPDAELWEMDAWMLRRTSELVRQCRAWYDEFEFHRVFHAIHDFATVDLSAFYFDVLKDRLYTFAPRNVGRRSAQTAVYRIAAALVRLLAPILTFTTEEVWKHLPHAASDPESVHLALFPAAEELRTPLAADKIGNWETLLEERPRVLKALEEARKQGAIGGGLEAKVILGAAGDRADLLQEYEPLLRYLFIVSQVQVNKRAAGGTRATPAPPDKAERDGLPSRLDLKFGGSAPPEYLEDLEVQVVAADGKKCERCWNYSTFVGSSAAYPTLCERCVAALEEIDRDGELSSAGASSR
jgi:isoleucyl-tRNA synthetase